MALFWEALVAVGSVGYTVLSLVSAVVTSLGGLNLFRPITTACQVVQTAPLYLPITKTDVMFVVSLG